MARSPADGRRQKWRSRLAAIRADGRVGVRQDDRELVAADAEGAVAVAERVPDRVRHPEEQLVAGRVALPVVHDLEVVEVDEQERHRAPGGAGTARADGRAPPGRSGGCPARSGRRGASPRAPRDRAPRAAPATRPGVEGRRNVQATTTATTRTPIGEPTSDRRRSSAVDEPATARAARSGRAPGARHRSTARAARRWPPSPPASRSRVVPGWPARMPLTRMRRLPSGRGGRTRGAGLDGLAPGGGDDLARLGIDEQRGARAGRGRGRRLEELGQADLDREDAGVATSARRELGREQEPSRCDRRPRRSIARRRRPPGARARDASVGEAQPEPTGAARTRRAG